MTDAIVPKEKSSESEGVSEAKPSDVGGAKLPLRVVSPPPKMSRRAQVARKRRLEQRLKRAIRAKGPGFKRWRSVIVTLGDRRFVAWKDLPAAVKEKDFAGARIRLGTILPCWGIQHLAYSLGKQGSQAKYTGKAARQRKAEARRIRQMGPGLLSVLGVVFGLGSIWGYYKKSA